MTGLQQFRSVYEADGVYDHRLLPHYYDGREDLDLITALLSEHHGAPAGDLAVAEFGCGTGRATARLEPYAAQLIAADYSAAMIDAVRERYPQVRTVCADTRDAVDLLLSEGRARSFDIVGAFWSLSYPLGEFFETMTADGIQPTTDAAAARRAASAFVHSIIQLLVPGGHLLGLFFDSDTPEQRLVTRLWERVAPTPEDGRGYTRRLLLGTLRAAEDAGNGALTHTRRSGVAWAPNVDAAVAWFNVVHLKSFPALVGDASVQCQIRDFVHRYEDPSGAVALPSGVHVIDFHATRSSSHHLPR